MSDPMSVSETELMWAYRLISVSRFKPLIIIGTNFHSSRRNQSFECKKNRHRSFVPKDLKILIKTELKFLGPNFKAGNLTTPGRGSARL